MSIEISTTDGLRLAGASEGTGDPVLLVHGLGFSRKRWAATITALSDAGYRAVSFDLRGFGDSDLPTGPYEIDTLATDIESVCTQLELGRIHLVGHSLGGMCSQLYALAHPDRVRSITLVSTTSHSGNRGSAYGAALSYLARVGFDQAMKNEEFRKKVEWAVEFLADPEVRQELNGTISEELPSGQRLLALIERMTKKADPARSYAWSTTVGFSTRKRLDEIDCPSLVMHGTRDMIIPYIAGQLLHSNLQGSRWRSFAGAGHSVPMECRDEFNRELLDFLQTCGA